MFDWRSGIDGGCKGAHPKSPHTGWVAQLVRVLLSESKGCRVRVPHHPPHNGERSAHLERGFFGITRFGLSAEGYA